MRIYFDTCALSRLRDDGSAPRIAAEALAVEELLGLVTAGSLEWVASSVLEAEAQRNPDVFQRLEILALIATAKIQLFPLAGTMVRANHLRALGYGAGDALHLALAEDAVADVLLTTDDRFFRRAAKGVGSPRVEVANPLDWLRRLRLP
jgi:predicted nucleic acid-binding protein